MCLKLAVEIGISEKVGELETDMVRIEKNYNFLVKALLGDKTVATPSNNGSDKEPESKKSESGELASVEQIKKVTSWMPKMEKDWRIFCVTKLNSKTLLLSDFNKIAEEYDKKEEKVVEEPSSESSEVDLPF